MELWYPVNRNWEVSEIGKLLASIVELQLEVDENDEVIYVEYCKEVTEEPNYEAVLAKL